MKNVKTQSLKYKLGAVVGLIVLLALTITIGIFVKYNRELAFENAKAKIISETEVLSISIRNEINAAIQEIKLTSNNLLEYKKHKAMSREFIVDLFEKQMMLNPNYFSLNTTWEPNKFDDNDEAYKGAPGYYDDGRFVILWYRENDSIKYDNSCYSWEEEMALASKWYEVPKSTLKPYIDFTLYPIRGKNFLIISLCFPILEKGKFVGVMEIDYLSAYMQELALKLNKNLFDGNSYVEVLSHTASFAANTQIDSLIGKSIKDTDPELYENKINQIKSAKTHFSIQNDTISYTTPLIFKEIPEPWQINVSIAKSVIMKDANKQLTKQLIIGFVILLASIFIIILMMGRHIKPLAHLQKISQRISEGDLSEAKWIHQEDEIGQLSAAFQKMTAKLREIITHIHQGSTNIASGSIQLSSSSQIIAQGANEQASSTEEVSSSLEEMLASINQTVQNAMEAKNIAKHAEIGILEGQKASEAFIEMIKQIALKITVINDIADKTDLLAINASIEASRAGKYGKGFMVVASEIRQLAESSQISANEIIGLVQKSLDLAKQSGEKLTKIVPEVQKTAQIIEEISIASAEQNLGVSQINYAVNQLNAITQQNSATSEELASNSEQFAEQAANLKKMVSFFILDKSDTESKIAEIESNIAHWFQMLKELKNEKEKNKNESPVEYKVKAKPGIYVNLADENFEEYKEL